MTKISARLAAVGVATLAITAGPAMAADAQPSKATSLSYDEARSLSYNDRVEDFVLVNLAERAWVGGDFKVAFEDGVVTLTGTVHTESTKARIGRIARDTIGVSEVKNALQVKPMAVTEKVPDDELARRVAREIASGAARCQDRRRLVVRGLAGGGSRQLVERRGRRRERPHLH